MKPIVAQLIDIVDNRRFVDDAPPSGCYGSSPVQLQGQCARLAELIHLAAVFSKGSFGGSTGGGLSGSGGIVMTSSKSEG